MSDATGEIFLNKYRNAEHWQRILEGCDALVAGDRKGKIAVIISGLSSGLKDKLHLYAMGNSQKGKSYTQERIGSYLFPNFEKVNQSSAKSAYYEAESNTNCFENTIKMFDEFGDQGEEFQNQIKAFTSQGMRTATLKTVDIKRKFQKCTIEGLPVIWTNSAVPIENEQILNRFWKINIDESSSQDSIVQKYQQENEKLGSEIERYADLISSAKSELSFILVEKNMEVLNPFADFWTVRIPANRNMRTMIIIIIKALAYSNRILRPHIGKETILASLADNLIAFHIWSTFEIYQIKKVPGRYLDFLDALEPDQRYTKQELAKAYAKKFPEKPSISPDSAYTYAHYLEKLDLMGSDEDENHKNRKIWYTLTCGRSTSKTVYGSDGCLTSLIFESLDMRIPKIEELAKALIDTKTGSLTKYQEAECFKDVNVLVDQLLDWDFLSVLGKTLDFNVPSKTGIPSNMSNGTLLDFVRDDSLANLAPESLEMKERLAREMYGKGKTNSEIEAAIGKSIFEKFKEMGIIPAIGGRA
jgi:hypothetical protein